MNKSSKETRMRRSENISALKLDSVYYKVVAGLLILLVALIMYIVWQQRNTFETNQSQLPNEEIIKKNKSSKDNGSGEPNDSRINSRTDKNDEEENTNKSEDVVTEGVEKNAPLDKNYEISYEEGSSDMIAILNLSRQVTGLGEDMYPVWIGNNGPGKVQATVSSQDNSKQFVVDLQFGEGSWHVTHVEQVVE